MSERTVVVANDRRGGGGAISTERITLPDTWKGGLIFTAGMVGLRLLSLVWLVAWVLAVGQGAGYLVIGCVLLLMNELDVRRVFPPEYTLSWDANRYRKYRRETKLALVVGMVLVLAERLTNMEVLQAWPRIYWEVIDGVLHFYGQTWGFPVSPLMLWMRWLFVVASAWVLWQPGKWLHWMFKIELLKPKARETGYAQADPSSVDGPDGEPYAQPMRRAATEEDDEEPPDVIVGTV